jgi:hypothetical protein
MVITFLSCKQEEEEEEEDLEDLEDMLWPPELEGLPLGDICYLLRSGSIAAKDVPERRKALDKLGFSWVRTPPQCGLLALQRHPCCAELC